MTKNQLRAKLQARGSNISCWAQDNHFNRYYVKDVVNRNRLPNKLTLF